MVYVYYNLRLQVKQIDKEPNRDAISLDNIDTLSDWRVESEEPAMEEAPEWLAAEGEEEDVSEGEQGEEEVGGNLEEDIPLPQDEEFGFDFPDIPIYPPQRPAATTRGAERQLTLSSTIGRAVGASTSTSTPGSSRATTPPAPRFGQATSSARPPTPPTSRGRGRAVPLRAFTRKRGRGNQ